MAHQCSDGRDEYKLLAPELMRNVWVEQVSIEDKEVKPLGGLYAVEFDDEGEIDICFVPIRPGTCEFFIDGMPGCLVVKWRLPGTVAAPASTALAGRII